MHRTWSWSKADRVAVYQIQDALVDLTDFGYEDVKGNFSDGVWKDWSIGDGVYGAPVDGGPMAMIYRKDVFEQYGITPPTTWAEYEAAAQTVKDAGGPLFGDFARERARTLMALLYQNGAEPFTYDPSGEGEIGINLMTPRRSRRCSSTGAASSTKGLVGTQDQFTPEYISGVIAGDYATYISAAWAPGYLQGAGVGEGADADVWATAPLPQWDAAENVQVNWGGSGFAVTSQAKDPELAAKVAFGFYADCGVADGGMAEPDHLPAQQRAC